ncbi:hypothetical protein AB0G05_02785 [Nonomuraea wenchangensis]
MGGEGEQQGLAVHAEVGRHPGLGVRREEEQGDVRSPVEAEAVGLAGVTGRMVVASDAEGAVHRRAEGSAPGRADAGVKVGAVGEVGGQRAAGVGRQQRAAGVAADALNPVRQDG